MALFLQILGVIFLIFLILIVGLVVGWRLLLHILGRRLQSALEPLAEMRYAYVPARVHLVRQESIAWQNAVSVENLTDRLQALGFRVVGDFTTQEMDYLRMRAAVKEDEQAYGLIYEHDKGGVWYDIFSRYENGDGITATTAPQGQEIERRPGKRVLYETNAEPEQVYHRFLAERSPDGLIPVSAGGFAGVFERGYAETMDWRNSRGGATEEEIRRTLAASGDTFSDEAVSEIRQPQLTSAIIGLQQAMRERYLEQTSLSAREWEEVEDRLIFIFDLLPRETVALHFPDQVEPEEGGVKLPPGLQGLSPRHLFAALNELAPADRRFTKLDELSQPVPTDVYAAPEGCEGVEDDAEDYD